MTIRICVSILPETPYEARKLITHAEDLQVDFIEIRLDNIGKSHHLVDLTTHVETPLIAADHSRREESEHQAILLNAAKSGFNYIDVPLSSHKLQNFVSTIKATGAKSIVSFHDYSKTLNLNELNRILEREVSSGADVCKIVTTATKMEDNLTLLQFLSSAPIRKKPICFAMGELGKTSRLLSPVFGSFFTFATLEQGSETASGQMTVQEMRTAYEILGLR
ncbi:MAG: type I 3-dehydroquinate dehydratase [Crenarchaeota archaeon]|nr:type I 3-dehydroquinate dehydratase [Thermoproteota archaeon]